jgi:hypothetical protein
MNTAICNTAHERHVKCCGSQDTVAERTRNRGQHDKRRAQRLQNLENESLCEGQQAPLVGLTEDVTT